jgi:hypothetical protein
MTDIIELEAINVDLEFVEIKEHIEKLLKDYCESRIISLLEENDKDQFILRKIRNEDWKSIEERNTWICREFHYYLAFENDSIRIGKDIRLRSSYFREWNPTRYDELMREIIQPQQNWKVLYEMADDYIIYIRKNWEGADIIQEDMDYFFMALLAEYNRQLICNKSYDELLDYVNMLCPDIIPK